MDSKIVCTRCKNSKSESEFKSIRGRTLKMCIYCREYALKFTKKCEHGKIKNQCRECHGISFCIHDKRKSICKDCNISSFCIHNKLKSRCRECKGSSFCMHNKLNYQCRDCHGSSICIHNKRKCHCKKCSDSVSLTIKQMIFNSKISDIKFNRYDANNFIDICFIEMLMDDSMKCHYCKIEMQTVNYDDTLCTIERLNNSIGHVKNNCLLACRKCNLSRVGQRK